MSWDSIWRKLWFLISLTLVVGLVGCSEKTAAPTTATTPSGTGNSDSGDDDDGDDDDGDDDDGDDDDGSSFGGDDDFDLCDAIEDENGLDDWSKYVDDLCGEKKVELLRQSKNLYKGGSDTKVSIGSEKTDGNEVEFRLYSASLVPTSAEKYYKMLRLQFFQPDDFDDEFERDPNLSKYEILDDSNSSVEYRYINTKKEASPVDYEAESRFFTLESKQAYVVATKLTKSNETMVDLKALIIVNRVSSSKTEVFIISDQTYDKGDQETSVARKNATEALEDEQIRAYENAETADDFF